MPGAIIAIDQDRPGPTTSAGSPGVARKDLWVGQVVRPRCTTTGNGSFAWVLLDKPAGSAATITGDTSSVCAFTPDLPGSYRLQLTTNGGGPGNVQVLIAACTFDVAGGLVRRGWRQPAVGEVSSEDNFAGQTRGWDADLALIFEDILAFIAGGGGGGGGGGNGSDVRAAFYNALRLDPGRNGATRTNVNWLLTDVGNDTGQDAALDIAVMGDFLYVPGKVSGTAGTVRVYELASQRALTSVALSGAGNPSSMRSLREAVRDTLVTVGPTTLEIDRRGFQAGNVVKTYTAPVNWTDGRVAVLDGSTSASIGSAAVLWTAPLENKIYAADFAGGDSSAIVAFTGGVSTNPTAICVNTEDESIWVSFVGDNTLRRFTYDSATRTLTQTHSVGLAGITELCFDGTFLWALNSSTGVLYKRKATDGSSVGSWTFSPSDGHTVHARSKMVFDGTVVWVGLTDAVVRVHPTTVKPVGTVAYSGGEIRGLAVDASGNLFAAQYSTIDSAIRILRVPSVIPAVRYDHVPVRRVISGLFNFDDGVGGAVDPSSELVVIGSSGPVSIGLPSLLTRPTNITIVDGDGQAPTNNITISANNGELINGAATLVLDEAYSSVTLGWNGTGWNILHRTSSGRRTVTVTATYTIKRVDATIAVGTLTGAIVLSLPASPQARETHRIKDVNGTAAANNITVSGNGNNIDGASTLVINTNYESLDVEWTGSKWSIV